MEFPSVVSEIVDSFQVSSLGFMSVCLGGVSRHDSGGVPIHVDDDRVHGVETDNLSSFTLGIHISAW